MQNKKILITGGGGFIGSNFADRLSQSGYHPVIFDNFVRKGTKNNAKWLISKHKNITVIEGDIRNYKELIKVFKKFGFLAVYHLAAQVAVTTSVIDPRNDFEINALGTFNLLEAVRNYSAKSLIVYSSTNKVYGGMEDLKIIRKNNGYFYKNLEFGIDEKRNLDFHSPYGCSKGSADQYVNDYGRIYKIPVLVLRQSCIYGPRQFGVEDQGWIAWFIIATVLGKKISVYGDGYQTRDVLYVEDLIDFYMHALENINKIRGKIYNIGGGINNTLAVWKQFGPILEKLFGKEIIPQFNDWRPGDQRVYISDIRKISKETGWSPKTDVITGINKLYDWVIKNKKLFR